VAEATHGETVTEVLGSGDGAKPHQRFTLAKPPLTYVSAAGAGGARSTLRLRVSGVLWQEAAALYGLDGRSESYVVRREDDGKTRVQFGDGEMGARLPTGSENVTAVYRSGIGQAGMVAAGSLTLLQTRPLGVRGVTNPLPAAGAADPESRDDARGNAPLTVLTLDRIVSRRDYEDFARAFAGVGKAQAVPLKDAAGDLVHVTIAAAAPPAADPSEPAPLATRQVDPVSPLYRNLVAAIDQAHDAAQRFRVDTYDPRFFNVRGRVLVDAPRYEPAAVLAAVEATLKAAFAFERRGFAQRVTAAEVLAVMQNVPGVVAAYLHQLYPYQDNQTPPGPDDEIVPELLEARPARYEGGRFVRAELLLINPVGVALEEMEA
jgi:predicted phage baseplate assembly protein